MLDALNNRSENPGFSFSISQCPWLFAMCSGILPLISKARKNQLVALKRLNTNKS